MNCVRFVISRMLYLTLCLLSPPIRLIRIEPHFLFQPLCKKGNCIQLDLTSRGTCLSEIHILWRKTFKRIPLSIFYFSFVFISPFLFFFVTLVMCAPSVSPNGEGMHNTLQFETSIWKDIAFLGCRKSVLVHNLNQT